MTRGLRAASAVLALLAATAGAAAAQAGAGPAGNPLDLRISVRFDRADLATALSRLRTMFGVPLAYSREALPAGREVSLSVSNESVRRVLETMLGGTGLRLVSTGGGTIVIAPADRIGDHRVFLPALATGVRQLDQIVVMGTPVAGAPEREQPNAVSVVRTDDLGGRRFSRTADLIRTALPGVVLWDRGPSGPPAEIAAVRGASSFTARGVKTYVDGVEVASPTLFTLIDPRSIERIEVIRGPQGAALYGSDAINGVIQIITRKGHIGEAGGMNGWATAAAGPFSRAALGSTLLRQDYAGAAEWAGNWSSAELSGSLDQVGSPATPPSTRNWSLNGGGQMVVGSLLLSGSARAGQYDFVEDRTFAVFNAAQGPASYPASVTVATAGVTAVHQTTNRWTQTLVLGYDRSAGALGTGRSTIGTLRQPLDATHEEATRASVRFSSTLDIDVADVGLLAATGGIEYNRLNRVRGAWDYGSEPGWTRLYGDRVDNTGAFMQGKLRAGPLVLSGGFRTEWNSSFGPSVGSALASNLGASWTLAVGAATVRLRSVWGRGIRPPDPGMSRRMAAAFIRQEANPSLAPEVQTGIEAGIDVFSGRGAFVRMTLFDQRATDLIQSVLIPSVEVGPQDYQYQNVGAIRNRGVELETGSRSGRFGADALFYYTDSRVERLSPTYSGFLRPGDPLPEVPAVSGAARLSYAGRGFALSLGASVVGRWTGFDWTALARTVYNQDRVRPSLEDYLVRYPSVIKPYLSGSLDLASQVTTFFAIDNLTNTRHFERHNGNPPAGRSVLVGFEIRP